MKKLKPGRDNKEERLNFVKYWAEYVRTHSDKEWSKQQKVLIDSQLIERYREIEERMKKGLDVKKFNQKDAVKYLKGHVKAD